MNPTPTSRRVQIVQVMTPGPGNWFGVVAPSD
jgi:hypothetical protein